MRRSEHWSSARLARWALAMGRWWRKSQSRMARPSWRNCHRAWRRSALIWMPLLRWPVAKVFRRAIWRAENVQKAERDKRSTFCVPPKMVPFAPGRTSYSYDRPYRLALGGAFLLIEEVRRPCRGLAEQGENGLRRLIGDRQSLNAKLLTDLQGLQLGALLRHVRVDQVADALSQGVGQLLGEGCLDRELRGARRQLGQGRVDVGQRGLDRGHQRRSLGLGGDRGGGLHRHDGARQAHLLGRGGDTARAVSRSQRGDLVRRTIHQVETVEHRVLDDRGDLVAQSR